MEFTASCWLQKLTIVAMAIQTEEADSSFL